MRNCNSRASGKRQEMVNEVQQKRAMLICIALPGAASRRGKRFRGTTLTPRLCGRCGALTKLEFAQPTDQFALLHNDVGLPKNYPKHQAHSYRAESQTGAHLRFRCGQAQGANQLSHYRLQVFQGRRPANRHGLACDQTLHPMAMLSLAI